MCVTCHFIELHWTLKILNGHQLISAASRYLIDTLEPLSFYIFILPNLTEQLNKYLTEYQQPTFP